MSFKTTLLALKTALSIPIVNSDGDSATTLVAMFNNQPAREKDGSGYTYKKPACFIEPIFADGQAIGAKATSLDVVFKIMLQSDAYNVEGALDDDIKPYELKDKIHRVLNGLKLPNCSPLIQSGRTIDTNHDNQYFSVLEYSTTFIDMTSTASDTANTQGAFIDILENLDLVLLGTEPPPPTCTDAECANGRGISFVRIAGWDITTSGSRININDVTLQIAENSQFTGETNLVSIWDTSYDLVAGLFSFTTLTQANNYIYADNYPGAQKFIIIVGLPGGGELATSTFFVELNSNNLVPLIMPLQRTPKLLTFDIRCTNPTPDNFILPFDFYFKDGDGTYFIDTYITTDTGGISILGVDTQENYFDVSELNLNILDLYFNLGIFCVTQGEEFDFYESINRVSVVCRP